MRTVALVAGTFKPLDGPAFDVSCAGISCSAGTCVEFVARSCVQVGALPMQTWTASPASLLALLKSRSHAPYGVQKNLWMVMHQPRPVCLLSPLPRIPEVSVSSA